MKHRFDKHLPRFSRITAGVLTALTIISMSVVAPLAAAPASAAPAAAAPGLLAAAIPPTGPIPVPACSGTTSTPSGAANTPTGFTFAESSSGARDLRAGKTVMLYGNHGGVYVDSNGNNNSTGQGGLPYCGARVVDGGEIEADWRFCTDEHKRGCAEQSPGPEWSGTPSNPLSDKQKLQISHVLINASLGIKRERAITQIQVWCISENIAEGSVNVDGQEYSNRYDFQGSTTGDNLESRKLSNDEARCGYLPDLVTNPTLTLTGPSDVIEAGNPATFTLTTNVTTPITLTSTGGSPLQLCPAAQNGVTFNGTELQLSEPGTATLCAYSTTSAAIAVTADTGDLPQAAELTLLWNGNQGCQVFADYVEGAKTRLSQTANANFIGSGTFAVTKAFDGVVPTDGDLDDVTIELTYTVTGGPTTPPGTPSTGRLLLNQANGFSATGPSYPDGTTVLIEETAITGLPAALEQQSTSWTVDGQMTPGDTVEITVGDGSTVAVTLTDFLTEVLGTFEVRKSFAFDNEPIDLPTDTEVQVRWWVKDNESTTGIITLNVANDFMSLPGADLLNPALFPLGTTILLEEVSLTPSIPGVSNVIDWGSNTDPSNPSLGMVTIAEEWVFDPDNPAGNPTAAEIHLTNGIDLDHGSLTVRKLVTDTNGGAQSGLGDGSFDDMEILVTASWMHPMLDVSGSNVSLLNKNNNWTAGLGVELPVGTEVTLEETDIRSIDPSIEWIDTPLWSCNNCTPAV